MSSLVPMLFVTWQAPESRRIFPIARVSRRPSGEYEWAYVRAVEEARTHGFTGLPGHEDIGAVSVSPELPALFAHRVPARARRRATPGEPANDAFDPTPITLLVPVAPGTNERLEVFAPPLPAAPNKSWGVFVARGVGRITGSELAAASLQPHDPLGLRPEPGNPYNPRALLILTGDGEPIGYVPDYLANELAEARGAGVPAERGNEGLSLEVLSAERVNHAPAAPIYNVLCRYTCSAELGARLFRSERYQPVAEALQGA